MLRTIAHPHSHEGCNGGTTPRWRWCPRRQKPPRRRGLRCRRPPQWTPRGPSTWHGCILTYEIHRRPCKIICHDAFITQHHGTVASRERSDGKLKLSTAGGTTWTLLSCAVNCCCKWSCAGTARITSYARKSHVRRWDITRVVGDGQQMLHDVFVAAVDCPRELGHRGARRARWPWVQAPKRCHLSSTRCILGSLHPNADNACCCWCPWDVAEFPLETAVGGLLDPTALEQR